MGKEGIERAAPDPDPQTGRVPGVPKKGRFRHGQEIAGVPKDPGSRAIYYLNYLSSASAARYCSALIGAAPRCTSSQFSMILPRRSFRST